MLQIRNPYTQEIIAEVPLGEWRVADRWLDVLQRLHRDRGYWLPAFQRTAILERTATIMSGRAAELAYQIADEGGPSR